MRRALKLAIVTVWYFLVLNNGSVVVLQVGPFATQTACEDYRTNVVNPANDGPTLPCFSTTAKE